MRQIVGIISSVCSVQCTGVCIADTSIDDV